jgi:hypothetical protein
MWNSSSDVMHLVIIIKYILNVTEFYSVHSLISLEASSCYLTISSVEFQDTGSNRSCWVVSTPGRYTLGHDFDDWVGDSISWLVFVRVVSVPTERVVLYSRVNERIDTGSKSKSRTPSPQACLHCACTHCQLVRVEELAARQTGEGKAVLTSLQTRVQEVKVKLSFCLSN